jgi:predicted phage terminase large subunit-like protein
LHITSIEYVRTDWFYDLTVPFYENYEHKGLFHHNTATFTPRGKLHWTYERFGRTGSDGRCLYPDTEFFKSSSRDNPFVPETFVGGLQSRYTSTMREQEIEGEFVDAGGTLIKREWWRNAIVPSAPLIAKRVRYWDKAATDNAGCYTCGVLMAQDYQTGLFYIESVVRGQWSTFKRDEIISMTAQLDAMRYGPGGVAIYIEQEPGSGGKDSLAASVRGLAGHVVRGDRPTGDKRTRAEPFAAQVEAGNVKLVDDKDFRWIPDFIEEAALFPDGKYVDQVDAASGAFNQLLKGVYSMPVAGGGSLGGVQPSGGIQNAPAVLGGLVVPALGDGPPGGNTNLRNFRPR